MSPMSLLLLHNFTPDPKAKIPPGRNAASQCKRFRDQQQQMSQILVKTGDNKITVLEVAPCETVEEVKWEIQRKTECADDGCVRKYSAKKKRDVGGHQTFLLLLR